MQKYIVVEITQNEAGSIGAYSTAHETEEAAYSKYYTVLSIAAKSASPVHGAILMSFEGFPLEHKCFKHAAPDPEPTE